MSETADNTPASPSTVANPTGGDPGPDRGGSDILKSAMFNGAQSNWSTHDPVLAEAVAMIEGSVPQNSDVPQGAEQAQKAEQQAAEPAEKPTEVKPPETASEPISRGWAAVKEAEKAVRLQRDELNRQQREFQQQRQQFEQLKQQNEDFVAQLRADPFRTLQKIGVPFEQLADMAIKGEIVAPEPAKQTNDPVAQLVQKIEQLEQKLTQKDVDAENKRLVQEYRGSVERALDSDDFKLLKAYPTAVDEAMELTSEFARRNNKLLTPEQALSIIQDTFRTQLQTLGSNQAVRELLGVQGQQPPTNSAPTPQASGSAPAKQAPAAKTITQALAASSAPPTKEPSKAPLTEAEILAEAAKLVPSDAWSLQSWQ